MRLLQSVGLGMKPLQSGDLGMRPLQSGNQGKRLVACRSLMLCNKCMIHN